MFLVYSGLLILILWWLGFNWSELNVNGLKKCVFGFSCFFLVKMFGLRVVRFNLMGWNIWVGLILIWIGFYILGGVVGMLEFVRKIRVKE